MRNSVYTEEIKVRVPIEIKRALEAVRKKKFKSESEVAREAFILYLEHEGDILVVAPSTAVKRKRRPQCLDWLDDYPLSPVAARDTKSTLKERIALKNGLHR